MYVPLFELLNEVPGRETVLIATLSLTTAVKVTVCDCEEVARETLVSSAPKLSIDGSWLSVLVTVTLRLSVVALPVVSVTVTVKLSVLVPKLKSA